jgi:hypothetical protein
MAIINARYAKPMPCPVVMEIIVTMPFSLQTTQKIARKAVLKIILKNTPPPLTKQQNK